jgi:hypothetical protein
VSGDGASGAACRTGWLGTKTGMRPDSYVACFWLPTEPLFERAYTTVYSDYRAMIVRQPSLFLFGN